jgi:hypothetical protein
MIRRALLAVRRWWWLGVLPLVLAGVYLGVSYRAPAPAYQVVMRFTAGTSPATTLSLDYDRYYPWLTSEYVANGLADAARTGVFAEAVSARLAAQGVKMDPGAVQGAIVSDNAQSLFVIYLNGSDPQLLTALAEAVTAEVIGNGPAYFPQIPQNGPAARRLDDPQPVAVTPGLRAQLMQPLLVLLAALVCGMALMAGAEWLRPAPAGRAVASPAGGAGMERFDIATAWRILRRWWWLAALPVVAAGGYLAMTYRAPAPVYQLSVRFAAGSAPEGLSVDYDRYYPWLTSEYIANGLADVAQTGVFAKAVAARLPGAPAALPGTIRSENLQSILTLHLSGADPQSVGQLLEAVTAELMENAGAYFPQIPAGQPVVRRLDNPTPAPVGPGMRDLAIGAALRLLLAAVVGLGLALLADFLTRA